MYSGRDGEFRLYEDDGSSLDYLKGKFTWTRLKWNDRERRLTIEPEEGSVKPGPRTFVVEMVPGGQKKDVRYTGERVEVRF